MYDDIIIDNNDFIVQLGGAYRLEISNKRLLNSHWFVSATKFLTACLIIASQRMGQK